MWTETDRRLGMSSAASVAAIGLLYVLTGALGVAMRPAGLAPLAQVDPYLAVLEILIMLVAVALVVLSAAILAYARPETRTCARASFAFMLAFAVLTLATHFVSLALGRRLAVSHPALAAQLGVGWPSVSLALDLLAWDLLLGLALLFLAPVFGGDRRAIRVRRTAFAAGTLCLTGTIAPLTGAMEIQLVAVAGYAFVLPVLCAMIARLFARETVSSG